MSLNLEAPRTLPVHHLSYSSISTYLGCPERWRRRYLEGEYEPTNQKMLVGKVVGRAIGAGYMQKIREGTISAELLADTFDTEWTENTQEEVDWEGQEPGVVKDSAAESLLVYATTLMPHVTPVTVEESFEIRLPETDWATIGYLDFVAAEPIYDLKVSARAKTQLDLDNDPQATMYVAAKASQEEWKRRPFKWHAVKRPSPGGRNPAVAVELETARTQLQVNNLLEKIALVAREIDWRVESGNWQGAAPGYWLCGERTCGFFPSCKWGGLK